MHSIFTCLLLLDLIVRQAEEDGLEVVITETGFVGLQRSDLSEHTSSLPSFYTHSKAEEEVCRRKRRRIRFSIQMGNIIKVVCRPHTGARS